VRGSRRSFGIDLGPPFHELRLQIRVVQKAALLTGVYNVAKYRAVSDGYFETIGTPVIEGLCA